MKIFVIGKNGFIAQKILHEFQNKYNLIPTSSQAEKDVVFLDLQTPENFDYDLINKDDFVIHLAAISSPDACEQNYETAYQINVKGAQFFLKKCLEKNAKVLFFSSDVVYGNSENCFDENSTCEPFGVYAEMKHETEQALLAEPNAKIFRLSYVFAKNDKFTNYLKNCAEKNEAAELFHPFFRNAVYLQDLVDAIEALIKNFDQFDNKIFNISGPELLSRKDLAQIYQTYINQNLKFNIVTPEENFFKKRPKSIKLKSLYLNKLLDREPLAIEKAMQLEFNK
ncbi:sugar nucleotide-binding protein [Candidatus Peregrinibacteria bacterium]|jgi:dTDP-4-dehydrorhamnose reductase|nr:sugar nucleotide-binding protein [Candidatus Peregrinibacteria bacterium]MBT7483985.1 sugar nucleotide-binding protein [Candidatus Peregrinibacteria bacterium]MBT7703668.1 sugar nucleotide-binding protein [Candidatus Peregrinibacteria bacterium]